MSFFRDRRLLSRQNLLRTMDAFTHFGFDSMLVAIHPNNKKAQVCMIGGGDELKSRQDEYLLMHRLLTALKKSVSEQNIDLDFTITLKEPKKRKTKKEKNE